MGPLELVKHNQQAIDADRRRRRETAVSPHPTLPPRMSEALRHQGVFVLPDEDDPAGAGDLRVTDSAIPLIIPGPPPQRDTAAGWLTVADVPGHLQASTSARPGRLAGNEFSAADAARPSPGSDPRQSPVAGHAHEPSRREAAERPHREQRAQAQAHHSRRSDDHWRGLPGEDRIHMQVAAAFEDRWLALHRNLNPDALPGTRDLHVSGCLCPDPRDRETEEHLQGDLELLRR